MTTCVIVGAIVSCLIDPTTRSTPAEAARILGPLVLPAPADLSGPRVIISPTPVTSTTPRRLDGTPLWQPPQVYGIPYPWTPLTWAILHSGR